MARADDLTGQRFGRLTVLERMENKGGRVCWRCRCDCGRIHSATSHDLKAGKVKSCGCLRHDCSRKTVDLTGRRFGRLTVLYPTEERDKNGTVVWKCRCDCGKETKVSENGLVHGNYRSCGCLKREAQQKITGRLHFSDGTCIEILEYRKHRRDNVSGFRGVFRLKSGKYRVSIGFKRKRYTVGTFENYEDACIARLKAEKIIHEGFIDAYYKWQKKAEEDPGWAQSNPLVFDVIKDRGELKVISSTV